jgi:hypothetical protein
MGAAADAAFVLNRALSPNSVQPIRLGLLLRLGRIVGVPRKDCCFAMKEFVHCREPVRTNRSQ